MSGIPIEPVEQRPSRPSERWSQHGSGMEHRYLSEKAGSLCWPHLTPPEAALVIKLYAVWLLPNWLLKVLAVAEAIRRYRR